METYYDFDRDYTIDYKNQLKKIEGKHFKKTDLEKEYENYKIDLFSATCSVDNNKEEESQKSNVQSN